MIGLLLIALGTGGIKPCVSAFGGDQFTASQVSNTYYHFRSTLKRDDFFAYGYFLNLMVLSG